MKHLLPLLIFLSLFACGSEESVPPATPGTEQSIAPAPDAQLRPAASGDLGYTLMALDGFREVAGCTVLLRPENAEAERYVYGFNYAEGPAEGIFEGTFQSLEVEREENETGSSSSTYVHANDAYEVTTEITREIQVDNELWEVSGTVTVRNRQTGKTVRIRVLGDQGC